MATALEAYRVDWEQYPAVATAEVFGREGTDPVVDKELSGADDATVNADGEYTITGEEGPIVYIEAGSIGAMYNPFYPNSTDEDEAYTYVSDANGTIYSLTFTDGDGKVFERTNTHSDLQEYVAPGP